MNRQEFYKLEKGFARLDGRNCDTGVGRVSREGDLSQIAQMRGNFLHRQAGGIDDGQTVVLE